MLPLLANLANGNHFLPTLAANHQAISAGLFASHSAVAQAPPPPPPPAPPPSTQAVLNKAVLAAKLCQQVAAAQAPGAGPMDLETINDERTESNAFLHNPPGSELNLTSSANTRKIDQDSSEKVANFSTFNPCDMIYNMNNMNVPAQNLMMMSGVMNLIREHRCDNRNRHRHNFRF